MPVCNIPEGRPPAARYRARKGLFGAPKLAVFVAEKRQKPLMPCSQKRARLPVTRGRAVVHRCYPFAPRLKDRGKRFILSGSNSTPAVPTAWAKAESRFVRTPERRGRLCRAYRFPQSSTPPQIQSERIFHRPFLWRNFRDEPRGVAVVLESCSPPCLGLV
jgi:hypothetical protein